MSATKRPTSGGVDDLRATLRRRHTDPPADESADTPADEPVDTSADARVDARTRESAEAPTPASVDAPDDRTAAPEGEETGEPDAGPETASQGPRRMLEVKARAYMGGWRKLRPRANTLAEAVRAVLAVGGTAAEVRGLLAEVGVTPDAMPPEVKEALKRR